MTNKHIKDFIHYLDREKGFFDNIEEVNKYNIGALAELVQYYNIKEYGDYIYKKSDLKKEIQTYLQQS